MRFLYALSGSSLCSSWIINETLNHSLIRWIKVYPGYFLFEGHRTRESVALIKTLTKTGGHFFGVGWEYSDPRPTVYSAAKLITGKGTFNCRHVCLLSMSRERERERDRDLYQAQPGQSRHVSMLESFQLFKVINPDSKMGGNWKYFPLFSAFLVGVEYCLVWKEEKSR